MKNVLLYSGIALALIASNAQAKGHGNVYKVHLSASSDFTYNRARLNALHQYGVDLEEVLQKGAVVEVCKDTAQKNGDPWFTCRYLVPAVPLPKTYTVYDNRRDVTSPFWGYRHQVTLREAHDQGLTYRICAIKFVDTPNVRLNCPAF